MSSLENPGGQKDKKVETPADIIRPKDTPEEREAKEAEYKKLLAQGKGLEAVIYAFKEDLISADQDIYDGMQTIVDAMDEMAQKLDALEAEYDNASDEEKKSKRDEIKHLEEEYNRLGDNYDTINTWAKTSRT